MSKHSDGTTWLTKLERIGKLAERNHELVFNNLEHLIDPDLLMKQYIELEEKKAIGVDGQTKRSYGIELRANITQLITRIRSDKYRPQPARIVQIPKEDGSSRPLAISCFEDKIVQSAVSKILESIFEPIFLPCSYGFRPGKDAHEALRELNKLTYQFPNGAIVEIDIRKYFNTIPHKQLRIFLEQKISDRRFLRLVQRLIEAPIIENDTISTNKLGCPQGSIISPILANIYLHYVIDCWFNKTCKEHLKEGIGMIRYADDMVFVFQSEDEAKSFYEVLPKRLNKYGLLMHEDKSQVIKSGNFQAAKAAARRERLKSYNFLGFTCYWGKTRDGLKWRLKFTSRRDRFTAKLKGLKKYLRENLNCENKTKILKSVVRIVIGWINYHGISDNKRVQSFLYESRRIIFNWFNRKGGRRQMNWERCMEILKKISFPVQYTVVSMFTKTK